MNWNCPHCNHHMVLTSNNRKTNYYDLLTENTDWYKRFINEINICSNDDCWKISFTTHMFKWDTRTNQYNGDIRMKEDSLILEETWPLIPNSKAKIFPNYIPQAILDDYNESCLIQNLSPKASATLSRRCLQWIIRDFWWVKKWRLIDEINALENTIDPLIYKAIDWTRKIWNIWAHMEKDINLIIDVDEDEAGKLIKLIEILLKECYITRYEREQNLTDIIWISEEKEQAKK